MTVGDKIQITPHVDGVRLAPVMATVIYIHPHRRYYTVEYTIGSYTLRECFPFQYRRGDD